MTEAGLGRAALLRAYRATEYEAAGAEACIGRRSAAIDRLLRGWGVRTAAFIGAANPGSRRRPAGWNRRRHAALLARLRQVPHAEGDGRGRSWSEPHVLAALPPGRAAVLARRFGQAAIVVVARERPARLWLLAPIDWRARPASSAPCFPSAAPWRGR